MPPVLGDANCLQALDCLSAPKLIENGIFLRQTVFRKENCDWFPYDFFSSVAKELLCSDVPRLNNPINILSNNSVAGKFYNGSQLGLGALSRSL